MKFVNLTPHEVVIRWVSELLPIWGEPNGLPEWAEPDLPQGTTWELRDGSYATEADPHSGIGKPIDCELRIPPSGAVARLATERQYVRSFAGIPALRTAFGEVDGLPEPQPGVTYIVSALVLQARPERDDLAAPGEAIRDEAGRIVACSGLSVV